MSRKAVCRRREERRDGRKAECIRGEESVRQEKRRGSERRDEQKDSIQGERRVREKRKGEERKER